MSLYNGFPPGTRPASEQITSAGCLSGAARSHSPRRLAPVPLGPRRAGILRLAAEVSRYDKAKAQGDFDVAAVIAGECVDLIHDLPPAGEIVVAMVRDAEALLKDGWTP